MRPLVRHIDRLQRLAVFDAAARLDSFSAAGRELGIAQPAVSRHIAALERSLGVDLFDRQPNRIALTDAGRLLAESLDVSFGSIEFAISEITQLDDVFVLAMPPGFAQQLVVPVLDSLQVALGDRDLRLWLYDRESELVSGTFHAAVRVGAGEWPGLEATPLFAEVVLPVAAPSLADELGLDETSSPSDVLASPLLHMEAEGRPWMSWNDWLAHFDLSLTAGRRRVVHNNYPTVVQQALAGRGVALGWRGLIEDMLSGDLLRVVGPAARGSRQYYLTWPARRSTGTIDALADWLDEQLPATKDE